MPNPENLKPFPQGNKLGGRKKGSLNRQTLFNRWAKTKQEMQNPFTGKTEKLTQDDIAVLSLLKEVRAGNVKAIQEWLDNRFGKLTDKVEHSGQIEIDLYENLSKDELKKELDKLGLSDKLFDK